MHQSIDHRRADHFVAEDRSPGSAGLVRGDDQARRAHDGRAKLSGRLAASESKGITDAIEDHAGHGANAAQLVIEATWRFCLAKRPSSTL